MNLLFLSPHFPPNFYHFCVALRRRGVNVLGIADEPWTGIREELKSALAAYFKVDSMENYDSVHRGVAHLIHGHGRLDRIESHNEHWMDLEARLRLDFNVPGPRPDEVLEAKRKSRMKARFQRAGVPVARGAMAADLAAAREFVASVGYPIIAKPDVGVGASATHKISSAGELSSFFDGLGAREYFLEEFVQGTIVTFDGLTDQGGNVVFSASHEYSGGIMEAVNDDTDIHYFSNRAIPEDVAAYGARIVEEFDVRARFFHIEFFRTASAGALVALEANLRPPGGYTIDMFNYANDIDLYEEWANVLVRNRFVSAYSRPYHCCYVGRKGRIEYRHTHEDVLGRLAGRMMMQTSMPVAFRRAMGDHAYIFRAEKMEEMLAMVEFIRARKE